MFNIIPIYVIHYNDYMSNISKSPIIDSLQPIMNSNQNVHLPNKLVTLFVIPFSTATARRLYNLDPDRPKKKKKKTNSRTADTR